MRKKPITDASAKHDVIATLSVGPTFLGDHAQLHGLPEALTVRLTQRRSRLWRDALSTVSC
jgi:hypothetical protein